MNLRERVALVAAVVMLGAVCFKYLIYDPQTAAYAGLVQTRDGVAAEVASNRRILARAPEVRREYRSLTAFVAKVQAKLPAGEQVPALLTAMERLTKRLGITLKGISPGPVVPVVEPGKGAVPAPAKGRLPAGAGRATAAGTLPYSSVEVRLSMTATFAQTIRYLDALRDFPRLIVVDSISLAPEKLPALAVNLGARMYMLDLPASSGVPGGR